MTPGPLGHRNEDDLHKWWVQLWCKHRDVTNKITVSGYGYTEYRLWFCCRCDKPFIVQTRDQA